MKYHFILLLCILPLIGLSQNYGDFPKIEKGKLLRDLDLLYQALDQYHSGMYWYTPKDSVDAAFKEVKEKINQDMDVLSFHKLIAPLVALSREDHTDISLPEKLKEEISLQGRFLPLTVVFLGERLYCLKNGSDQDIDLEGKEIIKINGVAPQKLVSQIGSLFASDGYIKAVKYSDLSGFALARYFYYYFGNMDTFTLQLKTQSQSVILEPLEIDTIRKNIKERYPTEKETETAESLEFKILKDSIAYLGVHSFSNSTIKENKVNNNYKKFLQNTFKTIQENQLNTLIIDVSQNGGGTEGNEGLLFSYLGENYQKYKQVRAKAQKVILDNGVDDPIKFKTFGLSERLFFNKKMPDGSFERKKNAGHGLMAYKKEPKYKFRGKLYVIISPVTYSGGSEFSNMIFTRKRGTFVGQETGGGFYGNTSGYSRELILPHSKISIDIPLLQYLMNVKGLPFGSGVIPDHKVIPTIEEYQKGKNTSLKFILDLEAK